MANIRFPFSNIQVLTMEDSATPTVTITDPFTRIINPTLGQAVTGLILDADTDQIPDGARVFIDITQSATGRDVTLNATYATAPVLTGVASDRDVLELEWNATTGKFTALAAAWSKIVDAA